MIMPLSFRKTVLCGILALAAGGVGFSQAYTTNGTQYAIIPPAPGDQINPQLGLNSQGGYLVWNDNAVDGRGQGIGALALDNNFAAAGSSFRVNQIGAADQENPQVALLNNGGAAFVWQSGRRGFQHIYARFLGAGGGSNFWLGGDVVASTFTNNFQINPAMAALANGNVILVWASYNQYSSSSMQDVYGQLFSPAGQKLGGEFLVNQFTAYNQRTPAVAALAGGGFVVAWASEQEQRPLGQFVTLTNSFGVSQNPSVDIYARLYDGNASALGNEFLVDLSTNICANPSVAAGSDGGFLVAWTARDASNHTNSWDIYAMPFSGSVSNLLAVEERVNSYTLGDQYVPRVSAVGTQYQVLWTSLGQDGSREGVFGQFVNGNGSFAGGEYLVNTTTQGSQIYPATASGGTNRFLAVWSSFGGLTTGFDLFAQLYAPPGYAKAATVVTYHPVLYDPYPDPSLIAAPAIPIQSLAADGVVSNAFASAQGSYHALFYNTNGITPTTAGYITLHASKKGSYSGSIYLAGHTYPISGSFNSLTGWATNTVGKGANALTVQIQLDLGGGLDITGQILNGDNWTAQLAGDLQATQVAAATNGFAGYYVMTIPPASAGGPDGNGYGTVKVDGHGNVKWSGTLSDGTKVSQNSGLSADGIWPLYAAPYGGKGTVMAWMQFASNGTLSGDFVWVKPAGLSKSSYPEGFTNYVDVSGSLYVKPSAGQRLLSWTTTEGNLILSGGGLLEPLTNNFSLGAQNRVSLSGAEKFKLNLNVSLGLFNGKALGGDGKEMPFSGVLWPEGVGLGFFSTPNQSGTALLAPAPAP